MNAMRIRITIFGSQSQQGAALIIAVMILLILTVIGIYAVTTSTIETKIAGSDRALKEAFYTADCGEPIGVKTVKVIIQYVPSTASDLPAPWNDIVKDNLITSNEIFTDGRNSDSVSDATPNIKATGKKLGLYDNDYEGNNVELKVDIDRLNAYQITGGATEYGSGYEGIGQGGGGDIGINYAIESLGNYTLMQSESRIEAGYRYVVGVPGGE
jgi:hypothetical protein